MAIDWFTIVAQAINFVILIGILKRFLYKPILDAIDTREKKVADELAAAQKKMTDANRESNEYKKKNLEFDQERAALLSKATSEAQVERDRLLDEARHAVVELRSRGTEALKAEENGLKKTISLRIQAETSGIARKALSDLAGADLEERMLQVFISRLRELSPDDRTRITKKNSSASSPLVVLASSSYLEAQRAPTEGAIKEVFGPEAKVQFMVVPELICGIELSANGYKLCWNVSDYLEALDGRVNAASEDKTQGKPGVGAMSKELNADLRGAENGV